MTSSAASTTPASSSTTPRTIVEAHKTMPAARVCSTDSLVPSFRSLSLPAYNSPTWKHGAAYRSQLLAHPILVSPALGSTHPLYPVTPSGLPTVVLSPPVMPTLGKRPSIHLFADILQPLKYLWRHHHHHRTEQQQQSSRAGKLPPAPPSPQQQLLAGVQPFPVELPPAAKKKSIFRTLFHVHHPPPRAPAQHILVSNYLLKARDESLLAKEFHLSMKELDEMIRPMQHLLQRDLRQGFCRRHCDRVKQGGHASFTLTCHGFGEDGLDLQLASSSDVAVGSFADTTSSTRVVKQEEENGNSTLVVLPHMNVGDVCEKYGTCFRVVGRGSGGTVRLLRRELDGRVFAVKEFRKRRSKESVKHYAEALTREYCIGSVLHHPNVIQTIDMIIDHGKFYEVMEYCATDLFRFIESGRYTTAEIDCYFKQIMEAVLYLHNLGIAHRDLKPENICIGAHGRLKIIDFGMSYLFKEGDEFTTHKPRGLCGSTPYIAPEEWESEEYDAQKVDVWSTAIIYLTMVFRAFPWESAVPQDANYLQYLKSRYRQLPFVLFEGLEAEGCRYLMERMLDPRPAERITTKEICADPWFQSIDVCTVKKQAIGHQHAFAKEFEVAQE